MSLRDLIQEEHDILDHLGHAIIKLGDLPQSHPADLDEFAFHIHACQNIILARPATEYIMQESELAGHIQQLERLMDDAINENQHELAGQLASELERLLAERAKQASEAEA